MITRIAFLKRSQCILPVLFSVICLLASAAAQHGGGGGHSGGGHFGGGRSSSGGHSSGRHTSNSQTAGHSGWWHFGFGKHSARNAGFSGATTSDISARGQSRLWNIPTAGRMPATTRIPSTLLWSPLFPSRAHGQASFVAPIKVRHVGFFFNRYRRFPSSGCIWNGVSQVCFFEPFLPLFPCYGGISLFYSGFDLGGDSLDLGGDLNSEEPPLWEMSAMPPAANLSEDERSEERPAAALGAMIEGQDLGNGVFLLVLNNGSSHAVTDYWVSDGYLEYINPDGSRSHIPLEALDLQRTVTENAPRGLPFVLRSTPAQNR
jgi:hypothetical protein